MLLAKTNEDRTTSRNALYSRAYATAILLPWKALTDLSSFQENP